MTKNRLSRYARAVLFMMTGVALMAGCVREGIEPGMNGNVSDGSVTLSIAMPDPVQKTMTRSVPDEYTEIKDLNIIITTGNDDDDEIQAILYVDLLDETKNQLPGSAWVNVEEGSKIHFDKEWFENFFISSEDCAFFLVANWGNRIGFDTDRIKVGDTVKHLKEVKVERRDYAMFGESADAGTTGHDDPDGGDYHTDGRNLTVQLERMVAMITVEIDGEHLASGVEIIPISISLHNVPNYGTFGVENVLTGTDRITPLTDGMIIASGPSRGVAAWGKITTGQKAGGHYADEDWSPADGEPDWSNDEVMPLFMYENYHGNDFGEPIADGEQAFKRPAASFLPADYYSTTPTKEEIAGVTGACSYLEVRANYRDTRPGKGDYGEVTYRIFLGANHYNDFNVMRNAYYRVTLDLSGGAIGEKDYSWRMSANLGKLEIIGDSDLTMNGGGESALIQIAMEDAKNGNAKFSVEVDSGDPGFVWINTGKDGATWTALGNVNMANFPANVATQGYDFQFRFFVQPMIPGVTWNGPGNVRQVRFRFRGDTNSSDVSSWLTITQYSPIPVTIDEGVPTQEISDYAKNVLGWTLPRTFYLDRVDNDAMPWGFETVQIDANGSSGIANGNFLMQAPQATIASRYLPYGLDNNTTQVAGDGSAMMHTAFMRYYQRSTPVNMNTNPTIADIQANNIPNQIAPANFFIPSVNEWRLLDMLFEAGILTQDQIGAMIWNDYWTSDAVEGVSDRSYIYNMGNPEETIEDKNSMPRTTPVVYRMMYW